MRVPTGGGGGGGCGGAKFTEIENNFSVSFYHIGTLPGERGQTVLANMY